MLKVGDKVKLIKGNPFGKIGKIISKNKMMSRITNVNNVDIKDLPLEEYFIARADDGIEFSGPEDCFEKLE